MRESSGSATNTPSESCYLGLNVPTSAGSLTEQQGFSLSRLNAPDRYMLGTGKAGITGAQNLSKPQHASR